MKAVSSNLKTLPRGRRREQRRLERAVEARRRLADSAEARHGGRAWINGEEVGGADPRFAHLSAAFD
jgi:glutathione S-transferase